MYEHLTGHDIANEVIMMRASSSKTVLIAEGMSDCLIMDNLVDDTQCSTLPAHGKELALEALRILSEKGHKGIVVLVDADHWHIANHVVESDNLIVTECYDMEMIMLKSQALDRIISEYASKSKYEKFMDASESDCLLEVLLNRISAIGALRYVSARDGLRLCFEHLDHKRIVRKEDLSLDLKKFVEKVVAQSKSLATHESLIQAIDDVLSEEHDFVQLCCGHDVTAWLAIALRATIGTNNASIVSRENVEKLLRLSFGWQEFGKTDVCRQMHAWERRNAPYRLFAA